MCLRTLKEVFYIHFKMLKLCLSWFMQLKMLKSKEFGHVPAEEKGERADKGLSLEQTWCCVTPPAEQAVFACDVALA